MKFNLIDVGSDGLYEIWKEGCINHVITFDPLDSSGSKSLVPYTGQRFHYPIAVFDVSGKKVFYVCRNTHMSSLFEPDMDNLKIHFREVISMFDVVEKTEVVCERLDTIIKEINKKFDFLKVDVQGAELNVLKSAGDFLSGFKGIQVECNHVSIYKGSQLTDAINRFLTDRGFTMGKKLFYKRHADVSKMVWNDYLYINDQVSLGERKFIDDIYTSEIFINRE